MEGVDGKPLNIFKTIAAGGKNLGEFGALLLCHKEQVDVNVILRRHRNDGPEFAVEEFAQKWLTMGGPTCTYQHFIDCVREYDMKDLADLIRDTILRGGMPT